MRRDIPGSVVEAPRRARGFTLLEMLVACGIVSVMAAASLPNVQGLLRYHAITAHVDELRSDVHLARAEAARRGETVTLCGRDLAGGEQTLQCGSDRTVWLNGWLVFVDRGRRGVVDEGDRILRVHQPLAPHGPVKTTVTYLSFQPTGISLNAASHFQFLAAGQDVLDPQPRDALLVCINKIGRSRVTSSATCAG